MMFSPRRGDDVLFVGPYRWPTAGKPAAPEMQTVRQGRRRRNLQPGLPRGVVVRDGWRGSGGGGGGGGGGVDKAERGSGRSGEVDRRRKGSWIAAVFGAWVAGGVWCCREAEVRAEVTSWGGGNAASMNSNNDGTTSSYIQTTVSETRKKKTFVVPFMRKGRKIGSTDLVVIGGAVVSTGTVVTAVHRLQRPKKGRSDVLVSVEWARRVLDGSWRSSTMNSSSKGESSSGPSDTMLTMDSLLPATTPLEEAIIAGLEGGSASLLLDAMEEMDLSEDEGAAAFEKFGSAQVSAIVDRLARNVNSDDFSSLECLNVVAALLSRLGELGEQAFRVIPRLQYRGSELSKEDVEPLYRRYAVFCLASEQRILEDIYSLKTMQVYLRISDEKAYEMDTEIAKAMFQVAISSVLSKGTLDSEQRAELARLKSRFAVLLPSNVADSIMSEVGVMRVLHELQKMLQEQNVTQERLEALKEMSDKLDVNVEEVMQSVDDLALVLGPEAKQFVEALRTLLSGSSEKKRR